MKIFLGIFLLLAGSLWQFAAVWRTGSWPAALGVTALNACGMLCFASIGPGRLKACWAILRGEAYMTSMPPFLLTEMPAAKLPLSVAAIEWAEAVMALREATHLEDWDARWATEKDFRRRYEAIRAKTIEANEPLVQQ